MMSEVGPLFGINQEFDYKWNEQVQEFQTHYQGNLDYLHEFIDSLVPIRYTDIWDVAWAYDLGHFALGFEQASGHTVYEFFQHEISNIYHDEFAEAWNLYMEEE